MKKIILGVVAIPVLCVAAMAGWFMWLNAPLSGVQTTNAVAAPTRIYRDGHGVPHIFADTLNDGYAALGYLHASDRLFQMEMMRRAGSGRLAEILGSDLINYDKKMRALGFYAAVKPYFDGLSPDTKTALEAYAKGVNAYLENGKLPAEFALLNFKPAAWNAWDGLIWAKMMAWQLSGNFDDEILREQLLQKGWTPEQINALYPPLDKNVPTTLKPLEWVHAKKADAAPMQPSIPVELARAAALPSIADAYEKLPHTASNAYVIAGQHTQSGKPILANDPHLQLQSPILWYLARIVTPQGELKGATAPGIPFFPLGQNSHVAWGFTTSNIDVQDITFIDDASKMMPPRKEIIHVKGADDVTFDVQQNDAGVVLSGIVPAITAITPPHKKALLQFTGIIRSDRTAQALYHMNIAASAGDIETALKDYSVPPQNLVYADDAGYVGYVAVGDVPQRKTDRFFASKNTLWNGSITQRLRLKDPSAGVIMTANQAIVDDNACAQYSCAFARDWAEPYRAMRLEKWFDDAFTANTKFDTQSASGAMLDITSVAATRFLPILLRGLDGKTETEQQIIAALTKWDGTMERNSPDPLIYHVWLDALMKRVFGANYTADTMWPRMWALEQQQVAPATIRGAFDTAIADLTKRHGSKWWIWRWGDEHKAPLKHPLWSHVPVLSDITSLKIETDGDGHTLKRAAPGDYARPFDDEHGAGYRGVYDLAQPEKSLFMIAGGESGQIFATHYGDLRGKWNEGSFITLTGDEQSLHAARLPVLTLHP